MYNIKIKIGGKKREKTMPTIADYRNIMEYNNKNKGKNFLENPELMDEAINLIASFFADASKDEIENEMNLKEIFETYKKIESNVAEVFTGVPLREALKTMLEAVEQTKQTD